MDEASSPSTSPKFKDRDVPPSPPARRRLQAVAVLVVLSLASVQACRQFTRPFEWHEPRRAGSLAWWFSPLEWNIDAGLPDIVGTINAVELITGRVVVAGNAGLLAVSEDEGRTWELLPFSPNTREFGAGQSTADPARPRPPTTSHLAPSDYRLDPTRLVVATLFADSGPSTRDIGLDAQAAAQKSPVRESITIGDVSINTPRVDFGPVRVGSSASSIPIQFKNVTSKSLTASPPLVAGDRENFALSDFKTCELPLGEFLPFAMCSVQVIFAPKQPGAFKAQVIFANISVELSGEGVSGTEQIAAAPPQQRPQQSAPQRSGGASLDPPSKSLTAGNLAATSATDNPAARRDVPSLLYFGPCTDSACVLYSSDKNEAFVSSDGGRRWKTGDDVIQYQPTHQAAIAKLDPPRDSMRDAAENAAGTRSWAVLRDGGFFRVDNNRLWMPVTRSTAATLLGHQTSGVLQPYGRFPGPWYLFILFLSGYLLIVQRQQAAALTPAERDATTGALNEEPADLAQANPKVRDSGQPRGNEHAIGGQGTADQPLAPGEPDALGLGIIATGLAFFFRNEKTKPPLVLAINGRWGSGKSSLMNLLRCRLEDYGACPVWFNAWHHQQGDQLLAALLQAVRAQSIPPLSKWAGWSLRLRLGWKRLQQSWVYLALVLGAIVLLWRVEMDFRKKNFSIGLAAGQALTWVAGESPELAAERSASMLDAAHRMREAAKTAQSPLAGELETEALRLEKLSPKTASSDTTIARVVSLFSNTSVLALVATLFAAFKTASRGLRAFASNPGSLMAIESGSTNPKDLEAQASFRQRFATEFGDVTSVLGPNRRMTILIDDLDRCRPEKVREVLEAVNFLCSSGQCFIVLGMAREIVEHCVGLSFSRVVDTMTWETFELPDSDIEQLVERVRGSARTPLAEERANLSGKRLAFARLFLDKLIQIEVAIPQPTPLQKRKLFETDEERKKKLASEMKVNARLDAIRNATRIVVPVVQSALLLLLIIGFGIQLGHVVAPIAISSLMEPPSQSTDSTQAVPASQTAEAPANAPAAAVAPAPTAQPQPEVLASATAAPTGWLAAWPFYIPLLYAFGAAAFGLRRLPHQSVRDAEPFSNALAIWHPLVMTDGARNTPRTARRFQNRVRYFAMRQRALVIGAPVAPVERWLRKWMDTPPPPPEPLLELPHAAEVLAGRDRDIAEIADWLTRGAEGHNTLAAVKQSSDGPKVTVNGVGMTNKELCALAMGQVWIPEPILVALAAINEMAPEWIDNADDFARVIAIGATAADGEAAKLTALQDAIARHLSLGNHWENLAHYRRAYLRLCSDTDGVREH